MPGPAPAGAECSCPLMCTGRAAKGARDLSGAAALIRWFLLQREEGASCARWLDLQDSHYASVAAQGHVISSIVRLQFVVNQLSARERTLLRAPADNQLHTSPLPDLRLALRLHSSIHGHLGLALGRHQALTELKRIFRRQVVAPQDGSS